MKNIKLNSQKYLVKKKIPLFIGDKKHNMGFTNMTNKLEHSAISKNSISIAKNQKKEEVKNQKDSNKEKNISNNKIYEGKKNELNKINSLSLYNSKSNKIMS